MDSAWPPALRIWSAVSAALVAFRSAATTRAPSRANSTAEARPMPEPAPVTTATRPSSLPILGLERLEHLVGVALDLDVGEHGFDGAVLVHNEGRARNTHVLAA